MEHRWGKRITLNLPVLVVHLTSRRPGDGVLENISLGGALVDCPWELNTGARIRVHIPEQATRAAGLIDATVVRCTGRKVGVEWVDFAPAAALDLVRESQEPAVALSGIGATAPDAAASPDPALAAAY